MTAPDYIVWKINESEAELRARCEMKLDGYSKVLHIEALTMMDMLWKDILPAVSACTAALAKAANEKKALSVHDTDIISEILRPQGPDCIQDGDYHDAYVGEDGGPHVRDAQSAENQAGEFDGKGEDDVLIDDPQALS